MRLWAAALAVVGAMGVARAARADCALTGRMDLPVTMMGTSPLISAGINGTTVQFIADSGAFFSSISPGSARELHLPMGPAPFGFTVVGVGGDMTPSIATVRRFVLRSATLNDVQFLVGGSETAPPAIGLLGQNVLGLVDVEYDLADGMIRLWRSRGCWRTAMAYWAGDKPYSAITIDALTDRDRATVGPAFVNGHRIEVQFDTGANGSLLTLDAAKRAGLKPDMPGAVFGGYSGGIGRRLVKTWIVPVASFKIGDEEIKNTRLRIGDVELGSHDMLLGADFFLSHRVFVANSQRKLYFTYNGGPVFDLRVQEQQASLQAPSPADALAKKDEADKAPVDAEGFSRRGAALEARGETLAAIDDFTHAIALAPDKPSYLLERARARMAAHQPFLAMSDLDAALKLKPDDAPTRIMRAALRSEGHDRQGALEDLDAASAALPKEADQRFSLGEGYLALDAFGPAIAQFDQWIPVHEDDNRMPQALNGRCWAHALSGEGLDHALSDCNRAVRTAALRANPLDSRGLVHLRRGEYAAAISDYDAALAINPKMAWSLYGRGVAELKTGDKVKGDADLTAAAALAPKLAERAAKLGVSP